MVKRISPQCTGAISSLPDPPVTGATVSTDASLPAGSTAGSDPISDPKSAEIELRRLNLEEQYRKKDFELREKELEAKRREAWIGPWTGPFVAALVTGMAAVVTAIVGLRSAGLQAGATLEAEKNKRQGDLIIEAIKPNISGEEGHKAAARNLVFLQEVGLVDMIKGQPLDRLRQLAGPNPTPLIAPRADSISHEPPDQRQAIPDTKRPPFNSICHITVIDENGVRYTASGCLVGPRTVLTAAYVVYPGGRKMKQAVVSPGWNGGDKPYGEQTTDKFFVRDEWLKESDEDRGYGILVLPKPFADVPTLNLDAPSDEELSRTMFLLAGYPDDKPFGTLWSGAGRIAGVKDRTLEYNLFTIGGMSGAPLISAAASGYQVIGIHTFGGNERHGIRITPAVINELNCWIASVEGKAPVKMEP